MTRLMFTFTSTKLKSLAGSHLEVKVVPLDQVKARTSLLWQLANVCLKEFLGTSLLALLFAIILIAISWKQNLIRPLTRDFFLPSHPP